MFEPLTRKFARRWQRRVAVHKLEALDDWLLADLGIEREDIVRFVTRIQRL